jgi:oligoendopeptidase F
MTTAQPAVGPRPAADLGELPVWNLADLYPGPDSAELKRDIDDATAGAKTFAASYRGKLGYLDPTAFGGAIRAFEAIDETLGRIMSYAQLLYSASVGDAAVGRFYQTMQERVTEISTELLFFNLEINKLGDADIARLTGAPQAARYLPWLRNVRLFRDHQLSEDLERLLHEKHVAGRAAWNRLFDETMADMRFAYDGRSLTSEEVLHLLNDPDGKVRETAARTFGAELGRHARPFALVTNTLAKDKEIEDRWRRFARPDASRHLANQVEPEVVDALVAAVKAAYPRLSHRYYRLKAGWFGKDALDYWDRNAPLPEVPEATIPWQRARSMVLDAYGRFSPTLAELAGRFFARGPSGWIDAGVRPGKAAGAFSHPTVPSVHPYILMNYQGKRRDVMTLAHELGHGVHQLLAAPQGQLMADTPLTLAETASVFGEMLTFRALLAAESDPRQRKAMLAGKVEDMLNTVVRQIAFYTFEIAVHRERRDGELTAERLCEHWLAVQRESLGPAIRLGEEYRWYWTYIPHFVHSPFYVYAYAFGECLVNSLYALYQSAHPGFADKYLDLLRAGGTKRHKELLAPFGLDAADPGFWAKGLGVVSGLIDELEGME